MKPERVLQLLFTCKNCGRVVSAAQRLSMFPLQTDTQASRVTQRKVALKATFLLLKGFCLRECFLKISGISSGSKLTQI